ncbi:MAG: 16S rRNA (cytosine(967)-C(5))-methyltransferase RsmB [Vicinamibacterales bacterium]|jgi:16S rRNA (cytosine967-C5)-methyltransferase|nr:16S rRNA (cytosine(967)-C(5))-methyltransferase RsmB [Acidobacteriota bacterium]MDP7294494.1 16S rRNA (cytosine(967)-C(5))-methyltransferase RsmB [Vicinamibacterales bacterium]MDP7471058.1 16S rRNA (cytosine(967)-C(5))-methyltransferase RsmB [Vicinamibacterales bacterium]MDP7672802.1 16S rRNA (cytosine(967)-C(5))-methyltransferase RsmB [Vicinamibacterales bacterium]HJO37178.1 16S rRNA (cytosine(967)-C(5))-methyltransferase RsmB [Vicinamibacterales bacterium]
MIAPARIAAFRALQAVTSRGTDLPDALHRARSGVPDRRDRALTGEIVTGTLRWLAALDHLVAHFADRPVTKLDPIVLDVLRISVYQLVHLDRVPTSAIVNDAVEITRTAGRRHATGLTNAVLRALSRAQPDLPLPPPPSEGALDAAAALPLSNWPDELRRTTVRFLSITQSHPAWLIERWLHRYGYPATLAWTEFNNRPARLTLRVNTMRTSAETLTARLAERDVTVEPARYASDGLVVTSGNPLLTDLASTGDFFVQDEASQLVAPLVQVSPGHRVFDACAAPGGKTVSMTAMMANRGLLVAGDTRKRRLTLLAETVEQAGAEVARLIAADLTRGAPFGPVFDRVLVDAPCTGLGTIRRDPEIRWRRGPDDPARLASSQLAMLHAAADTVRPGGRLVYATCSSEPEENERVVEAFLASAPAFRHQPSDSEGGEDLASTIDAQGHLRTYPHVHALDAFFGAALVRD